MSSFMLSINKKYDDRQMHSKRIMCQVEGTILCHRRVLRLKMPLSVVGVVGVSLYLPIVRFLNICTSKKLDNR